MASYVLSERAKKDIQAIGNYTELKWWEEQAEKYVRMLFKESRSLAERPLVGRSYDHYRSGLRGLTCGRHIIYYRILSESRVRIVRILYDKKYIPRHIK